MIKIIAGVYGRLVKGCIVATDSSAAPFSLTSEQEARLVTRGVAIYVDEAVPTPAPAKDEKPIENMNSNELRAYGKTLGLIFKVGMTKAAMLETIKSSLATAEDVDGSEADAEPAPVFDAAEAVR